MNFSIKISDPYCEYEYPLPAPSSYSIYGLYTALCVAVGVEKQEGKRTFPAPKEKGPMTTRDLYDAIAAQYPPPHSIHVSQGIMTIKGAPCICYWARVYADEIAMSEVVAMANATSPEEVLRKLGISAEFRKEALNDE